ncbi:hypothetical protein [Vibrio taketomensis]|nr:hypothetical protein [Vibrio taketomensis]
MNTELQVNLNKLKLTSKMLSSMHSLFVITVMLIVLLVSLEGD